MEDDNGKRRKRRERTRAICGAAAVVVTTACDTTVTWATEQTDGDDNPWKGKMPGSLFIYRENSRWIPYYLAEDPVYPASTFRENFRVPLSLFKKLWADLLNYDSTTWGTSRDAVSRDGIRGEVKVLVCLRLLGHARSLRDLDDSAQMGKETIRKYFWLFCRHVMEIYGPALLNRRPTKAELWSVQEGYKAAGFPGCVGAVDVMTLRWKNCPISHHGQYKNAKKGTMPTIGIEAWCDRSLYAWSWFSGRCGTNNDKTLLAYSPLFMDILCGSFNLNLPTQYRIHGNGRNRTMGYMLADGIYPEWPIFVRPIHDAPTIGEQCYSKAQEAIRKDIERFFGVIQARFHVLRKDNESWDVEKVVLTTNVCCILHNLLIRMMQSGAFDEEIACENTQFNLISQFLDEETIRKRERSQEVEEERQGFVAVNNNGQAGRVDFNNFLETLDIVQDVTTDSREHFAIRDELVAKFAAENASNLL